MAITLKTDYRKTLGLPGYSSHSFSASVEVEISNIEDAPREIQELYTALQHNVDSQIQVPGFIPPATYGMDSPQIQPNGQRNANPPTAPTNTAWKCSAKQKELILKLTAEKKLSKQEVEQKAQQFFHKGVTQLNKLEASGLIDMLFDISGSKARKGGAR